MGVNKVDYGTQLIEDTARRPSASIWKDCPIARLKEDAGVGIFFRDDFVQTALLATPTITTQAYYNNGWKAFGSAGGTLLSAFTENGGGLKADETDDNEGVNFATLATPFKIAPGKGDFWYEARLKVSTITANDGSFLAGLMDAQTLTVIKPITALGALADVNFFGFRSLEATPQKVDTIYKADGVTAVVVKTDILGGCPTTTALVADTYVKLGMRFQPYGSPYGANVLSFYVNGFKLPDQKTIPTAAGTDFPNDVQMGLVFAYLCGSSNDSTFTVDWVQCAQIAASESRLS